MCDESTVFIDDSFNIEKQKLKNSSSNNDLINNFIETKNKNVTFDVNHIYHSNLLNKNQFKYQLLLKFLNNIIHQRKVKLHTI